MVTEGSGGRPAGPSRSENGSLRGAVLEAVTSDVRPAAEIVYQIVADCEHRITDLPELPDLLSTTLR